MIDSYAEQCSVFPAT